MLSGTYIFFQVFFFLFHKLKVIGKSIATDNLALIGNPRDLYRDVCVWNQNICTSFKPQPHKKVTVHIFLFDSHLSFIFFKK